MTVLFEDRGFYYIPITQHVLSYAQCSESVFRMDRTSWRLPVPFGSVTMGESLRLPMTQFPCLLSEEVRLMASRVLVTFELIHRRVL